MAQETQTGALYQPKGVGYAEVKRSLEAFLIDGALFNYRFSFNTSSILP